MLELIFQGFIEWIYGLILECWEYFSTVLLDIVSMDFAYLKLHMPVIDSIMEILLAVGWALLIGNLVFQAAKTMLSGIGFEGEDPKLLFTRTFVFSFLLLASPQICNLCLNLTSSIIELLQVPDAVNITFADDASFGGLAASWLLVVICGIIVMFQSFKLFFEMAERYLILAVLTITAPLAFAMGGSRNTSDIFSGWCRMYGSMCLLMVMNVVFIKMLLSILSFYPSGLDVLPWMILVLATVKVAKKIDGIITRIGLNPAITGDSLGRTFPGALTYLVVRSAASQVAKTIGRSDGGAGTRHAPDSPPGGAGDGPRSGGGAGGSYFAGSAHNQHSNQQNASYRSSTQQGATVQSGPSQASAQEPSVDSAFGTNTKFNQASTVGETRRTSVPPSARHTVSHMRNGTAATPGTASKSRSTPIGRRPKRDSTAAGEHSAAHPGSSGTTDGTRFSYTSSPVTRSGSANGTVQAKEQTHTSVSQTSGHTDASVGAAVLGNTSTSAASGQHIDPEISERRFTHRETSATSSVRHQPTFQPDVLTGQATPSQPDTAGMARETPSVRPPRSSRNTTFSAVAPTPSTGQHSTTLQQKPVSHTPPVATRGTGPVIHHSPAGTLDTGRGASQRSDVAHRRGNPAKSAPLADGRAISQRSSPPSLQTQESLKAKKSKRVDRPDRGGERDGRKR